MGLSLDGTNTEATILIPADTTSFDPNLTLMTVIMCEKVMMQHEEWQVPIELSSFLDL